MSHSSDFMLALNESPVHENNRVYLPIHKNIEYQCSPPTPGVLIYPVGTGVIKIA